MMALTIAAAAAVAQPAQSAPTPAASRLLAEVTNCQNITDAALRLACYDASVGKLRAATDKQDVVVFDREEVRRTRRSLFGFALPDIPFFGGDKDKGEPVEARQFETRIARARVGGNGLWTMVLADGGTWQFAEPSRSVEPAAGDAILIKRTAFGGYLATVANRRAVRVQRIR